MRIPIRRTARYTCVDVLDDVETPAKVLTEGHSSARLRAPPARASRARTPDAKQTRSSCAEPRTRALSASA
jgi:hypothetical protein